MQVEIYADVVFVINLAMDFFILLAISKIFGKRARLHRLFLGAAAAAALYCVMIFFAEFSVLLSILSSVAIISAGILAAFYPMGIMVFVKFLLSAHVVAFAVGGCGIAIFYYTNIPSAISGVINSAAQNFSFKVLLAAVCVSYICIKLAIGFMQRFTLQRQVFLQFDLWLGGRAVRLNGLVDTGNSLVEPISNTGVIVTEHCAIKEILPLSVYEMFENNTEDDLEIVLNAFSSGTLQNRLRFIPFSSVGKKDGLLIGFRADKAEVARDKRTETINDVIIGICGFKLSDGGDYCALINPSLLSNTKRPSNR